MVSKKAILNFKYTNYFLILLHTAKDKCKATLSNLRSLSFFRLRIY